MEKEGREREAIKLACQFTIVFPDKLFVLLNYNWKL